jgi:hypothetical protein
MLLHASHQQFGHRSSIGSSRSMSVRARRCWSRKTGSLHGAQNRSLLFENIMYIPKNVFQRQRHAQHASGQSPSQVSSWTGSTLRCPPQHDRCVDRPTDAAETLILNDSSQPHAREPLRCTRWGAACRKPGRRSVIFQQLHLTRRLCRPLLVLKNYRGGI